MNHKCRTTLNAFTLTDVLMSLFVMAVIISTIFLVLNILYKQLLDYKNINEPVSEFNRLSYLINRDIFDSEKLEKNTGKMFFYFSDKDPVIWETSPTNLYAVREETDIKDTLKIPVRTIKLDTIRNVSEQYVCQRLTFEINLSDNNVTEVKFYKRLYPYQLLSNYDYEH